MAELDPTTALIVDKALALSHDPESIMIPFDPSRAPFVRSQQGNHGQWATNDRAAVQRFRLLMALSESYIGPYADLSGVDDANFTKSRIQKSKYKFAGEFDKRWNLPHETKVLLRRQFTFIDSLMRAHEGLPVGNELRDADRQAVHDPDYTLRPFVFPKPGAPNSGVQMFLVTDNAFQHISTAVDTTRSVIHTDDDDLDPNDETLADDSNQDSLINWPDPASKFCLIPSLQEFVVNTNIEALDIDGGWVHPRDYLKVFAPGTWVEVDIYCCLWDYSQSTSTRDNSPPSKTYQCKLLRIQAVAPPLPDSVQTYEKPSRKRKVDMGGLPLPKPRPVTQATTSSSSVSESTSTAESSAAQVEHPNKKAKTTRSPNKPAMTTGKKRLFSALKGKGKATSVDNANEDDADNEDDNMQLDDN